MCVCVCVCSVCVCSVCVGPCLRIVWAELPARLASVPSCTRPARTICIRVQCSFTASTETVIRLIRDVEPSMATGTPELSLSFCVRVQCCFTSTAETTIRLIRDRTATSTSTQLLSSQRIYSSNNNSKESYNALFSNQSLTDSHGTVQIVHDKPTVAYSSTNRTSSILVYHY